MKEKIIETLNKAIEYVKSDEGFIVFLTILGALVAIFAANSCEAMTAMAIVAGTAGGKHVTGEPLTLENSAEASPELLRNEIDERIVKIRPMATPIDQISRYARARSCHSMEVEYYSVDTKPVETTLSSVGEMTNAGMTPAFSIQTVDNSIFEVSETIMAPDVIVDKNSLTPLVMYVMDKSASTGLTVVAVNTSNHSKPTGLKSGSRLIRMGRAAAELDVQTAQFQALPTKISNYCQIFKAQVEQSTYQKIANKEVGWDFSDQEEAAMIDLRCGMEKNFLFGTKTRFIDTQKQHEVMLTGGIWNQTDKTATYPIGELNFDKLVEISRIAFTGNGGSSRKILIGGTLLIEELNKLSHTKVLGPDTTVTKWGLDFTEIVTKFGRLYVIASEIFDQCGHEHDAMIIDPEYITKYCHVPFRTERLNLRASGIRNTDAVVLTEASCVVLRYPQAHLRIIGAPA